MNKEGLASKILRTGTLKQANDFSECQKQYMNNLQKSQHFCAQDEFQDSCGGDSGGKVRIG